MYSDNRDEKEFFRNINRHNLGDKYAEVMAQLDREERTIKTAKRQRKSLLLLGLGLAAAVLLLIFGQTCFFFPETTTEGLGLVALVEQANEPLHILELDTDRGESQESDKELLKMAIATYNKPDYVHASLLFDSLLRKDSNRISYRLFAADCQSRLKNYESAIAGFEKALEKSRQAAQNDYQYCASFYLGINQILAGDHQAGAKTLEPLAERGFKKQEVQAILRAI